ncbi:MAG TPA: MFS transporter [Prolixibacteraceae bacterium]
MKTTKMTQYKVYGYRWVMLALFMVMVAANQVLWITFAPITVDAASFFKVSDLMIGILSMSFMIVYMVVSIPASWIIDTYGIKIGAGIGALLTGTFGLMRGWAGADFNMVLMAQIGIAIGQPFLLNSITKLSALWFPMEERATAAGLGTLAMYIGILAGMVVTPVLFTSNGLVGMMNVYGIGAAVIALIFLIFSRNAPPTPPCEAHGEERALALDGFKLMFKSQDFWLLMFIFFIGLGVFNCVTTWIENIMMPRGFTAVQAGNTGGAMIAGGIVGALIMPLLSDYYRRRTPFIMIALAGATIGLIGITFATSYFMLLTFGAMLGFFLLSSGPIGFQYGAEITFPASEGASNGWLLLMGQVSGIAFIFGMDAFKSESTGSMTYPLMVLIGLMIFSFLLSARLKESKILTASATVIDPELIVETVQNNSPVNK